MFKICLDIIHCSGVSNVDFEQLNPDWAGTYVLKILSPCIQVLLMFMLMFQND